MDTDLLRSIGLTASESKVYLALLELGSTTKGPLVDMAGVASSKIYELLERLSKKGLVSTVVRSGVKYFEAAPPSRILDYMDEMEQEIKEQKVKARVLVKELDLARSLAGIGSEVQVFKGMKGAATSFNDILNSLGKDDEYIVMGISSFTPHFERFVLHFHKERARRGIRCKIIVNELARSIGSQLQEIPKTSVRYVQKELFTPVVFILYGEKTLISIGLDEIFIQVRSRNLSQGLRTYAAHLWKIAKK